MEVNASPELVVVGRAEEGERRDQRAGADAGDDVEFRPGSGLGPAGQHAGAERAAAAAAGQRQGIDMARIHARIGFRRERPLLDDGQQLLGRNAACVVAPDADAAVAGDLGAVDQRLRDGVAAVDRQAAGQHQQRKGGERQPDWCFELYATHDPRPSLQVKIANCPMPASHGHGVADDTLLWVRGVLSVEAMVGYRSVPRNRADRVACRGGMICTAESSLAKRRKHCAQFCAHPVAARRRHDNRIFAGSAMAGLSGKRKSPPLRQGNGGPARELDSFSCRAAPAACRASRR